MPRSLAYTPDVVIAIFAAIGAAAALGALAATVFLGIRLRLRLRCIERDIRRVASALEPIRLREVEALIKKRSDELKKLLRETRLAEKQQLQSLKEMHGTVQSIKSRQAELKSAVALSALDLALPVSYGSWAIDPAAALDLAQTVVDTSPKVIVELGSGVSSVIVAATLRKLGSNARHIVVDHEEEFLEKTKRRVLALGPGVHSEFWHCPLGQTSEALPPWYSGVVERLGDAEIDLLFVDGPPGKLFPQARRPALQMLRGNLSARAIVLLDDANREEEREIISSWSRENPDFEVTISKRGKGLARFVRNGERG